MSVSSATVAPGFFDTLRIPVLEGRDFTERDDRDSAPVVIVNQTFAQRYFRGGSPVGRRVQVDGAWSTVAGLVKDSKYHRLTEPPTPYIYLPYRQRHGGEFWTAFFIRTVGPARGSFAAVRREAAAIDPNAGVAEVVEFEDMVAGSLVCAEGGGGAAERARRGVAAAGGAGNVQRAGVRGEPAPSTSSASAWRWAPSRPMWWSWCCAGPWR